MDSGPVLKVDIGSTLVRSPNRIAGRNREVAVKRTGAESQRLGSSKLNWGHYLWPRWVGMNLLVGNNRRRTSTPKVRISLSRRCLTGQTDNGQLYFENPAQSAVFTNDSFQQWKIFKHSLKIFLVIYYFIQNELSWIDLSKTRNARRKAAWISKCQSMKTLIQVTV